MNIGFLTPEYPHPNIKYSAGIGTSIKNLAIELIKQQHKVTVFVYGQNSNEVFNENGVTIHKIAHIKYIVGGWYFYRKKLEKYINQIINKNKIQLIEAPDWTGITAFMKFNIPLVIRIHGSDAYFCNLEGRKQKFKNYLFEKIALKSANFIISVSDFAAIKTKEIFKIKSNIKVIPNAIDLKKFKNNTPEIFQDDTLLYFGTLIRKKGVLELANIFNELIKLNQDVKLILIGNDSNDYITGFDSTYSLMINLLSEEAKPRVEYLGKVSYDLLQVYIETATICVFPSLAETFGMVTIEAMAMKKTVVTSNYGWNKDIIEDGINGYLRNPKDHIEFAETLNELLNNNEKNKLISTAARIKVEEDFDIKKIVKQNIVHYSNVINSK